jgi:hypothetical protein
LKLRTSHSSSNRPEIPIEIGVVGNRNFEVERAGMDGIAGAGQDCMDFDLEVWNFEDEDGKRGSNKGVTH